MAERKIPSNMQPWKANINGKDYEYPSGITTEVPEEVAALIDGVENSEGKPDPRASQRGIEKDVTQIVKDNFAGGVGYEETTEVVMLPETSFEIVAGNPGAIISDSFPYTLEVGQDYTVTLDGEAKTYTAIAGGGGGFLTNTSLDDAKSGNGWVIMVSDGEVRLQTLDPSLVGAHTISISGQGTKPHRIDSKYMPINYMPIKMLHANSAGNLFTDFNPAEPGNSPSVPLTYEEAFSLLKSGSPVLIFQKDTVYTVTGIRGGTWDSNAGEYKYIYFDVMDNAKVKTFTVENPNWGGVS